MVQAKTISDSWEIRCGRNILFGFAQAFKFSTEQNLVPFTKQLEEGLTLCSTKYIAGPEHIRSILNQAAEYWNRRIRLARNRSIDLLMRVTCQHQISKAIEFAGVSKSREIGLFGLVDDATIIDKTSLLVSHSGGTREDLLLNMDSMKERSLRRIHNLPYFVLGTQIPGLLEEKSVLLVFSK